ncbi:hypothetical protein ACWPKO_29950 (plasmid) [Coraliomargarita sp. W4R53]
MKCRALSSIAATLSLAVFLMACTAGPPPNTDTTKQPSTATITPSPDTTSMPGGQSVDTPGPCDAAVPAYAVEDESEVEQIGGATLAVPFDRGPIPHAAGETIVNEQGMPVAYIVAENDVIETVGARLCVGEQWLYWVNYVRRDGDALYPGDTLNLDAHTIKSVGDQNGVVHSNPLPEGFVIPPQK